MNVMTNRRMSIPHLFLALMVTLGGAPPVFADVSVNRYFKFSGYKGEGGVDASEKVFYHGLNKRVDRKRTEVVGLLDKKDKVFEESFITRVREDQIISVDHDKKSYAIDRISPEKPPTPEQEAKAAEKAAKEKAKYKIVKSEVTAKTFKKQRTINRFKSQRYIITWELEVVEVDNGNREKSVMTWEGWVTPYTDGLKALKTEERAFRKAYLEKLIVEPDRSMDMMGFQFVTGADEASAVRVLKTIDSLKGYPISVKVTWRQSDETPGGKKGILENIKGTVSKIDRDPKSKSSRLGEEGLVFESYYEITKVSTRQHRKEKFNIPAGYKQGKSLLKMLF